MVPQALASERSVTFLIASLAGGGAEKVLADLANVYAKKGLKVRVVTLDDAAVRPDAYLLDPEVDRLSLLSSSRGFLSKHVMRTKKLRALLRETKPDVLVSFATPSNILAIVASRGLKIRCVVSERTNPALYSFGWIYDVSRFLLYRAADCVVVQTESIARFFSPVFGVRTLVVPNFLMADPTVPDTSGTRQVFAVGRLAPEKGYDLLINAFARLAPDFPDWTVSILGEGDERESLQALIAEKSLDKKIQLCGRVEQPTTALRQAAIVVQPSKFEGFPNSLLEAMACGLPVIATYQAGDMLIENGVNGLLVSRDSDEALAAALRLLMMQPELRVRLGAAASRVNITHSRKAVIKLWDQLILYP